MKGATEFEAKVWMLINISAEVVKQRQWSVTVIESANRSKTVNSIFGEAWRKEAI